MSEIEGKIFDLERFRIKKQDLTASRFTKLQRPSAKVSTNEISTHMEKIKQSIQRINKLMEELKSISDKPHK